MAVCVFSGKEYCDGLVISAVVTGMRSDPMGSDAHFLPLPAFFH